MSIKAGTTFFSRKGVRIRHLEKHQGLAASFWYRHEPSETNFDVRDLPRDFAGKHVASLASGDRAGHKAIIAAALAAGYDFAGKHRPLPPDPENMNDERAAWAETALNAFRAQTGTDPEDALGDLLCDLMHWCDRHHLDFAEELTRAQVSYREETTGERVS